MEDGRIGFGEILTYLFPRMFVLVNLDKSQALDLTKVEN